MYMYVHISIGEREYRYEKGHFPPNVEAISQKPQKLLARNRTRNLRSSSRNAVGNAWNGLVDVVSLRLLSPATEVDSPSKPVMVKSSVRGRGRGRNAAKRRRRIGRRNAAKRRPRIGRKVLGRPGVCWESSTVFWKFR